MKHLSSWLTRSALLFPAVVVVALALAPASAPPPAWRADLAAAIREAKAAGKDVLVEFTVRDAVNGSPALDREVYGREQFLRGVGDRFVPVRLTVGVGGAAAADAGVVALAERWAVGQVPSLVLVDVEGRPYATVESVAESVDVQVALVQAAAEKRRRRDEAFSEAGRAGGAERARHLHAALQHTGRFATVAYEASAREIVSLDPDNAAKLNEVYAGPLAEKRIDECVQTRVYPLIDRADFAGAVAAIDAILADEKPPAAHRQTLVGFKGQILGSMGRKDDARRVLGEALTMAPQGAGADRIRAAIEQLD